MTDTQGVYFKEVCNNYMSEQVIDQTLSNFIESETRQQSNCALWRDLHNGRITSSRFSEIYHRRAEIAPNSICKRLMGYTELKGIPLPMKWGRDNEARARDAHLARMKALGHKDIQCKPSGLTLMPSHAFLGASADGIIVNHRHHEKPGVLGIKCPYSVDGIPVHQAGLTATTTKSNK